MDQHTADHATDAFATRSSKSDGRPTLRINLAAIRQNLSYVRKTIGPDCKLLAVVKADAYGHGMRLVSEAAREQVDGFVVATLDEAIELRRFSALAGREVIVIQPIDEALYGRAAIETAIRADCVLTPASPDAVDAIASIAADCGRMVRLHVHVDSGLRRCGVDFDLADAIVGRAVTSRSVRVAHLATHAAFQDDADHPVNARQVDEFSHFAETVRERVPGLLVHAAASGLALLSPRSRLDAVRVGAAMYGIDPSLRHFAGRPLRPAMRLTAPIISILNVRAGEGVGYGHSHVAERAGRLAILPVGYFDGYPRVASNRGTVMIGDEPCAVVGRVSMDLLIIDVTQFRDVKVADEVTVLDDRPDSPASAYALAAASETIPYEIVSRIGPRARRIVVDERTAVVPQRLSFDNAEIARRIRVARLRTIVRATSENAIAVVR